VENISPALLDWFYKNHRILPFRTDPSPYHVWLSEIMLQQTRVSAALPYYERFLAALPDIPALAACEEEKLHKLWEGLGYYSRVRNLQKAARIVCEQYGGQLPADYDALRALPGIGEYTAGAIASISFGLPVPAVDGNVLRVFARLYNDPRLVTDPQVKREFTARVMEHQPPAKAGDYNQALMELGALVCLPNGAPLCEQCPLGTLCRARAAGTALSLPQKTPPKARRITPVTVALVLNEGRVLLQQRPAKGLLAGAVGGYRPHRRRDRRPPCCPGTGLHRGTFHTPACCQAHFYPHRVAPARLFSHCAGAARPRRLRLGRKGAAGGRVHPARCLQGLQKAAADQIAVIARIDEISAFRIVIFCFSGYNSLIKMNSGSMNHRSPPEKECVL
jgi:A/G-specific adenine glycosylase